MTTLLSKTVGDLIRLDSLKNAGLATQPSKNGEWPVVKRPVGVKWISQSRDKTFNHFFKILVYFIINKVILKILKLIWAEVTESSAA